MSEWFQSLGPVQWFRDQFAQCPETATSCDSIAAADMFQLVLLAWLVAAVVLIGLDRLGSGLLGRSRPLAQVPPARARTWRWGRKTPPENYSLLPPGTTVQPNNPPVLETEPLDRPALNAAVDEPTEPSSVIHLPDSELPDNAFWLALSTTAAPLFGSENTEGLRSGRAPERYNPVRVQVESLQRDDSGEISWPSTPRSTTVLGDQANLSGDHHAPRTTVFVDDEEE